MDESLFSNNSESPRTAYNRKLISQLSELKQLRAERENIIRMNHYYIAQLSKFEVQVSELNTQLKSKEKEVKILRRKLNNESSEDSIIDFLEDSSHRSKESVYILELENKLSIIQQENDRLQEYYNYKNECDRLKYELEYSQQLRSSYEEKYNELLTKMMDYENDESLLFDENDTIKNLNRKIEMLQKANQDLHNEILKIKTGETTEQTENITEESSHPKFEEKILILEKENIELKQKIQEMAIKEHIKVHIISEDKTTLNHNHLDIAKTGSYSQPSLSQRSSISQPSLTQNHSYYNKRGGNLSKAESEIHLMSSNRVVSPNRKSTPISLRLEVPQTPEPDKVSPRTLGNHTPKFTPKLTPRYSNIGYSPRPSKLPSKTTSSKPSSVNHFFPSWLRNRKALYVKPPHMHRKAKKRVDTLSDPSKLQNDDKFADAFPEENELE